MRHKISELGELPKGGRLVVPLENGEEILLVNLDGEIYAVDGHCYHKGGPLGEGEIEEGVVTCPWHGWRFDLKSGKCLNMPGCDLKRYRVTSDEHYLYVEDDE